MLPSSFAGKAAQALKVGASLIAQVERELQAERLAAEAQERRSKLAIEQQQQELHHIEEQAHKEVRSC